MDLAGRGRTNLACLVLLFIGDYAHANIYMAEEAEAETHSGRPETGEGKNAAEIPLYHTTPYQIIISSSSIQECRVFVFKMYLSSL